MASGSGRKLCRNNFAAYIPIYRGNVAEPAECARARGKAEDNAFTALNDGYHQEHDFGHGKDSLASLPATT